MFAIDEHVTFGPFPSVNHQKTWRKKPGGKFSTISVNPRRPILGIVKEIIEVVDKAGYATGEFLYVIHDLDDEFIWKIHESYVKRGYEEFCAALDLHEELPEIVEKLLGYKMSIANISRGPDKKPNDASFSIESWRVSFHQTKYHFYDKNAAVNFYEENISTWEKYLSYMKEVEANQFSSNDLPKIDKIYTNLSIEHLIGLFRQENIDLIEIHNRLRGVVVSKNMGIL